MPTYNCFANSVPTNTYMVEGGGTALEAIGKTTTEAEGQPSTSKFLKSEAKTNLFVKFSFPAKLLEEVTAGVKVISVTIHFNTSGKTAGGKGFEATLKYPGTIVLQKEYESATAQAWATLVATGFVVEALTTAHLEALEAEIEHTTAHTNSLFEVYLTVETAAPAFSGTVVHTVALGQIRVGYKVSQGATTSSSGSATLVSGHKAAIGGAAHRLGLGNLVGGVKAAKGIVSAVGAFAVNIIAAKGARGQLSSSTSAQNSPVGHKVGLSAVTTYVGGSQVVAAAKSARAALSSTLAQRITFEGNKSGEAFSGALLQAVSFATSLGAKKVAHGGAEDVVGTSTSATGAKGARGAVLESSAPTVRAEGTKVALGTPINTTELVAGARGSKLAQAAIELRVRVSNVIEQATARFGALATALGFESFTEGRAKTPSVPATVQLVATTVNVATIEASATASVELAVGPVDP